MAERAQRWILLGALVLGQAGLLAGSFVPAPHSGGDNAGYLGLAHGLVEGEGYRDLYLPEAPPHTKYPPVFPLVLAGLIVLGAREWVTFKLVSALAILLSTVVTFLWVEARGGRWAALAVAGLSGASAAWLYAGNWILSDPLFVLLVLVALWALERGDAAEGGGLVPGWGVVGGAAVVLAYFTRSAGLPLVVAALGWGVLRGHRRWAAGLAGSWILLAGAWWLRARASGGAYASEFSLLDPYRPELGAAGLGDFATRVSENLVGYVGTWVPGGLVGGASTGLGVIGLALFAFAAVGWWNGVRAGPLRVAELFAPLYFGLLLLWPTVWSGDRFALPLFPLLLFWAGSALVWGLRRVAAPAERAGTGRRRSSASSPAMTGGVTLGVVAAVAALLGALELRDWRAVAEQGALCRSAVAVGGSFACGSPGFASFAEMARLAGERLPEGAVTVARKPRFFYLASGRPAISVPLTEDPDSYLSELDRQGVAYVVLDAIDGTSTRTTGAAISNRIPRFCLLATRGTTTQDAAFLFRYQAPDRSGGAPLNDPGETIQDCPDADEWGSSGAATDTYSSRVPILGQGRGS